MGRNPVADGKVLPLGEATVTTCRRLLPFAHSGYGLSMPFALRIAAEAGPARNSISAFAAGTSFAPAPIPAE